MTESWDGISWERESRIIDGPEDEEIQDFRDPKVFLKMANTR